MDSTLKIALCSQYYFTLTFGNSSAPSGDDASGICRKHGSVNTDWLNVVVKCDIRAETKQHYVIARFLRQVFLVQNGLLYAVVPL